MALATYPGVKPAETGTRRAASPPIFGLAPGGVCRAPVIAAGAVSSYLAISPFPRPRCVHRRRGGMFSVTLSVSCSFRRRSPRCSRGTLLSGVRTFLPRRLLARERLPDLHGECMCGSYRNRLCTPLRPSSRHEEGENLRWSRACRWPGSPGDRLRGSWHAARAGAASGTAALREEPPRDGGTPEGRRL